MKFIKIVKSVKPWLVTLLLFMTFDSCRESNLDVAPLSPSENEYFRDELEFERAVWGIYGKLTDIYAWGGGVNVFDSPFGPNFGLWLLPGDDITTTGSGDANIAFETFAGLTPDNAVIQRYYNAVYRIINRANVVLQKNAAAEANVYTTPGLKDAHRGEALFLRAYMFFSLWNYFGTAPIVSERAATLDDILVPSSEGTELLDQAILDLTEAASLLPTSWPANSRGRVTKNSAYGLLGKSLVYRGTVTDNAADFTEAIAAFNNISGARLVDDFSDNFAGETENNDESLFEFQASNPSGGTNLWLANDFDNPIGDMSSAHTVPFKENFNQYAYGGQPFLVTDKLINAFEEGDPRLELTVDLDTKSLVKYLLRDAPSGPGTTYNNPRILRYADVLLLKAEAIIMSGGNPADAIALINEVRQRARNTGSDPTVLPDRPVAETNPDVIMDWIMQERFVELAGEEGIRWMDLRRWHLAGIINLNTAFLDSENAGTNFEAPKHLNFPIPRVEVDRNRNVEQNPGY